MKEQILEFIDNLFKRFFRLLRRCGITCCCCNSQCVIDKSVNCPENNISTNNIDEPKTD